jgi:hypothetical protein
MHELTRSLARLGAQELTVADRRPIAGRERGLVLPELVERIVELAQVTTVALACARAPNPGCGPLLWFQFQIGLVQARSWITSTAVSHASGSS